MWWVDTSWVWGVSCTVSRWVDTSWTCWVSCSVSRWHWPGLSSRKTGHIWYIIWGMKRWFGLWIHLGLGSVWYCFQVTVTLTFGLWVLEISYPEHICYIFLGRNTKFGVWIQLGFTECGILFMGHCDLDLWKSFLEHICSIIPNFVCNNCLAAGPFRLLKYMALTFDRVTKLTWEMAFASGVFVLTNTCLGSNI